MYMELQKECMHGIIRLISINYEDTKQAIKLWNHLELSGLQAYQNKILQIQEFSKQASHYRLRFKSRIILWLD